MNKIDFAVGWVGLASISSYSVEKQISISTITIKFLFIYFGYIHYSQTFELTSQASTTAVKNILFFITWYIDKFITIEKRTQVVNNSLPYKKEHKFYNSMQFSTTQTTPNYFSLSKIYQPSD